MKVLLLKNFWLSVKFALLALLSLSLCACSDDTPTSNASSAAQNKLIVATVGGQPIYLHQVDTAIQIQHYDLLLSEYEMRFTQLTQMVNARQAKIGGDVEWLLDYPEPPRIEVNAGERPVRGNPQAPVALTVFCSYQSVHCAQVHPQLLALLDTYPGWVSLQQIDYPMHFHREGHNAARAARCAARQGSPWAYADGLYARARHLDSETYPLLAKQLSLKAEDLATCMQEREMSARVESDLALAKDQGFGNVPVVLINGLYTRGPKSYEHYAMWVERELRRIGIASGSIHPQADRYSAGGEPRVQHTQLPLRLEGTSLSTAAENSSALIAVEGKEAVRFSTGASLLQGVQLTYIHKDHVILNNHGVIERLNLRGANSEATDLPPLTSRTPRDAATMQRIEQPAGETRKLIPPDGVLPLGQEWLRQQLLEREELAKKFVLAEHEVDGYKLLRLEGIADSEFFAALGLEEGDVVLRVNDEWVHSGQNPLWDALVSGEVTDVTFMRNGLPQRLQYTVAESGYFDDLDSAPANSNSSGSNSNNNDSESAGEEDGAGGREDGEEDSDPDTDDDEDDGA
ncbi:thioredoxin domain-containing protein [Microbulbifer agarilyticus]|uniref:thioredoxin domain-containing protein n=1 Tax=Microbulbifer agarilyticus TaxID=260552 RepID=UPI001C93C76B|nr:thioredoxin domain-containing protein [Microbulbifer agarilyticus]MBY6191336.1 thioredoxin domain-containing protein [Microbulbifer agarilyticus]